LFSSNPHDFNQETRMLKSLTMENHKNLVELVATYKYKGKYHLLFPYAEANLRSLWESICMPYWNEETYLWVLDQMTGLASALNVIHTYQSNVAYNADLGNPGLTRFKPAGRINLDVAPAENKFGRHGDLKPENILWYIEVNKPGTTSVLQITDLGLGRFHRLESRSRVDPKTVAGSQTYMPPELPLNKLVSRKYDIWSLGCVFLEFITWLIRGSAGLENFNNLRLAVALDKVEDDTYYTLVPDGGHMRVVIREAVTSWTKDLHASPRCSKMVHEVLELVQNQLLVVDSHGRIAAQELYSELRKMLERSRKEIEYLVGRNPADKGRGFKMPDSQTM
jgi:serine/threonine protein kinase